MPGDTGDLGSSHGFFPHRKLFLRGGKQTGCGFVERTACSPTFRVWEEFFSGENLILWARMKFGGILSQGERGRRRFYRGGILEKGGSILG